MMVRTIPVIAQRLIAVMTENTKDVWVVVLDDPAVKHRPATCFFTVFIPSTVLVIEC
jgi:hypothetical protein